MIISPPFIRIQNAGERDASWVNRMMPVDSRRGFPLNVRASWHGGVHVTHTDTTSQPEMIRAIADGEVVSFRAPSSTERRDAFPLNYNGRTDDGYVLLKHKTDIGENGNVVYYSLYMHLMGQLAPSIRGGARIWRKDPIGQSGMVDNVNAFHFQVFCDNENMLKLTGRTTPELDISRDGRTDTVYGDIHFYLPPGTRFYESVPDATSPDTDRLNPVHTSTEPLFVSMTFEKGDCTMVTRRQNTTTEAFFDTVGEPLLNTDVDQNDDTAKYEYNLYRTARRLYPQNPSAGFELLRFGRIISTGHETLTSASAPLWRTVSFPGGTGMVNLASPDIKKFSDADFPHWTGWRMVDDDTDNNSQCNSPFIAGLQESGCFGDLSSRLACHFPLEWNAATFDPRYAWLKTGSDDVPAMSDEDYDRLKNHVSALCFDTGEIGTGRLWHFHPAAFITHFRKCCWLSKSELKQIVPRNALRMAGRNDYRWEAIIYQDGAGSVADNIRTHMNRTMQKHLITTPLRIACFLGMVFRKRPGWGQWRKDTAIQKQTRARIRPFGITISGITRGTDAACYSSLILKTTSSISVSGEEPIPKGLKTLCAMNTIACIHTGTSATPTIICQILKTTPLKILSGGGITSVATFMRRPAAPDFTGWQGEWHLTLTANMYWSGAALTLVGAE